MTDTRSWWPEGYGDDPAFQVRRQVYGAVTGGDYVRGSSVLTLPAHGAAVPHRGRRSGRGTGPGDPPRARQGPRRHAGSRSSTSRLQVGARGVAVGTIEITWGWPASIENVWHEVALVRSAFGRPSTVNDGQTIMSANRMRLRQAGRQRDPVYEEGDTRR